MVYQIIDIKPESDKWIEELKTIILDLASTAEAFRIEVNRMLNRIIIDTWFFEEIEGIKVLFPEYYIMAIKVKPPINETVVNHLLDIASIFLNHGIVKTVTEISRIKISDPTFPTLQIIFP